MRSPAFSIRALIAPVRLRAVASGLIIEKVRSIAMNFVLAEADGSWGLISTPFSNSKRPPQGLPVSISVKRTITGISRTLIVPDAVMPGSFSSAQIAHIDRSHPPLGGCHGEQLTTPPAANPRRLPCYANSRLLLLPQLRSAPRWRPLRLLPAGTMARMGITAGAGALPDFTLADRPMLTAAATSGDWSRRLGGPAGASSIAAIEQHDAMTCGPGLTPGPSHDRQRPFIRNLLQGRALHCRGETI